MGIQLDPGTLVVMIGDDYFAISQRHEKICDVAKAHKSGPFWYMDEEITPFATAFVDDLKRRNLYLTVRQ